MVEYFKSEKNYFYKLLKNGKKSRVSQDEYNKKYKPKKTNYKMKAGGNPRKLTIDFGLTTYQTIGDCIEELIVNSYNIYKKLLDVGVKTTIICGGQSPAYYCLAMMNFKIFNPDLVNIIILPHNKIALQSNIQKENNENYCNLLRSKDIKVNNNVVIIDGVHSGDGIIALRSALKHCFPDISVYTIAINAMKGIAKIKVDEEIELPCEPKFSDVFPRLVTRFSQEFFDDNSKFITEFINLNSNPVAEMIIDISQNYPEIPVKENEWYIQNNEITQDIELLKRERERDRELRERIFIERERVRERERYNTNYDKKDGYFIPEKLLNDNNKEIFKCPLCGYKTGVSAVLYPNNKKYFLHYANCPNKNKMPITT